MKHLMVGTLLALLALTANAQAANTGSLTLSTTVNADGTLTPTASWSTTPAATSCTASGDWSGTKAASGTETLPSFSASTAKAYSLVCNWPGDTQAILSWIPPTQYTDGTPVAFCANATDSGVCIAKYRVRHGTATGAWPDVRDVANPTAKGATWTGLGAGPHFFVVSAVTGYGSESGVSNEAGKVLNPSVQWTQQAGVKIPKAPTGLQ
jgi:hypothetical protein